MYKEAQKATPCTGCEHVPPALMDENQEAWYLWRHVQTQLRVSFGGIIGVDYTAVHHVAEALGIEMDTAMLHKMQALEAALLKEVK